MSNDAIKKRLGEAAAELILPHQVVGLGTGSTAFYFIERLIARCKDGLPIKAVATSEASLKQATTGGIPIADLNTLTSIDITVDGADEVDDQKRLIKGGGGALLREKIIASMSREMVVIVDETKLSPSLGKHPLPVEIVPFGFHATHHQIERLGLKGFFRKNEDDTLFVTDNGNLILDIKFSETVSAPEKIHEALIHLPGVVETGFFFNLAGRILVGFSDGQIVTRN